MWALGVLEGAQPFTSRRRSRNAESAAKSGRPRAC
jgi:hypothetical protein